MYTVNLVNMKLVIFLFTLIRVFHCDKSIG